MQKIINKILVENISLQYQNKKILSNVSFSVSENQTVALMGKSGIGKSSLIKIIAGLQNPSSGKIKLNHNNYPSVMFQTPLLQPWMTVKDNIELPAKISGIKKDCSDLLIDLGLQNLEKYYPWQLSGGQQRRVALARAIIMNPEILLLDEPFTGVDEITSERLYDLLSNIISNRKITCIISTHNLYEAIFLADTIIILGGQPASIKITHNISIKKEKGKDIRKNMYFMQEVVKLREIISSIL